MFRPNWIRIYLCLIVIGLLIFDSNTCHAQLSTIGQKFQTEINGGKTYAVNIGKGICSIAAALGLGRVLIKSNTDGESGSKEFGKWLITGICGAIGFAALTFFF